MKNFKFVQLILSILLCNGMGLIGAYFTTPKIDTWYNTLNMPFFQPPSWIFAPVWTVLYFLMGIFMSIIWQNIKNNKIAKTILQIFLVHLVLNTLWSVFFFGLENPVLGLIDILVLWTLIVILMKLSPRISKRAYWLLIPYLAWVSFATILNLSIIWLN